MFILCMSRHERRVNQETWLWREDLKPNRRALAYTAILEAPKGLIEVTTTAKLLLVKAIKTPLNPVWV